MDLEGAPRATKAYLRILEIWGEGTDAEHGSVGHAVTPTVAQRVTSRTPTPRASRR